MQRCAAGIEAELAGRAADAQALFLDAWEARQDAVDACIAAHYVARHQATPAATLHWNREALAHAEAVDGDRVRSFLASLHLNVAHSYEMLGDTPNALAHYELGTARLVDVPEGGYRDVVARGLHEGRQRVGGGSC